MKEKLKLYLDSLNDIIFVVEYRKIVFANSEALKLFKVGNHSELEKVNFLSIFNESDKTRIKDFLDSGNSFEKQLEFRCSINSTLYEEIPVLCQIKKLLKQPDTAFLFCLTDLSIIPPDHPKSKDIITKSRELLKTDSLKNIAAGISHNFNNALASMSLAIETLKMFSELSPKANELLDKIISLSHRMSKWTNQLLCYAKGGKYIIKMCNINEIVLSTLETLKDKIPNQVTITYDLEEEMNPIKADPAQIEEVIYEILLNSIESLRDNGRIGISTKYINKGNPISLKTKKFNNKASIQLIITDNGLGINDDIIPFIFEPFFSTKFQGRGLGLSAVWGIIENHDGEILVESDPGQGTKFEIFFPVQDEVEVITEPKKTSAEKREEDKAFVVSEDENVRFIIKTLLENYGFEVFAFAKVEEFFLILKSNLEFCFVYLDQSSFRHEDFDNITTVIRGKPKTKFLISLSYNHKHLVQNVTEQKNIEIIFKPFKYEDVVEILRKLLNF